jgi:hypothetical protein
VDSVGGTDTLDAMDATLIVEPHPHWFNGWFLRLCARPVVRVDGVEHAGRVVLRARNGFFNHQPFAITVAATSPWHELRSDTVSHVVTTVTPDAESADRKSPT